MKKVMLTTILTIAVAAFLALGASPAMAEVIYFDSPQGQGFDFDSVDMQNLMNAVNTAGEDESGYLVDPAPEGYPDDGGGEGYHGTPGGAPPADDGGVDEPVLPQNPGSNGGYDNPRSSGTPETPTTSQPPQSNTKLPNTGTQMAVVAAIGLMVIFTAYAVRRAACRRAR